VAQGIRASEAAGARLRLVPTPATANETATRSGEAYARLRYEIRTLRLAPGTGFSEADVCDLLGLSKAPVRDALSQLRREGLVVSAARSGYTVAPMTVKDARDLFTLRTLLEGEAAALAATRGGDIERLRQLDVLCQMAYDPTDADSVHEFLAVNSALHLAVADIAGNQRLTDHLTRLLDQSERYMHLGLRLRSRGESIVHEHRELVSAIGAGDSRRARRVAEAQMRESQHMVLDGLLSTDAVLTANIGVPLTGGG